jgi:hypothetical protein
MLRACVLANGAIWEDYLPFTEYSYNNSYQSSIQMAPFEALYGRQCRTPLDWSEPRESILFGPDILREAEEQVHLIQERLKTAQSRQKTYADTHHCQVTFKAGDHVYLKVTPSRGSNVSRSKESLHQDTLAPSRSPQDEKKSPTNLSYPRAS